MYSDIYHHKKGTRNHQKIAIKTYFRKLISEKLARVNEDFCADVANITEKW